MRIVELNEQTKGRVRGLMIVTDRAGLADIITHLPDGEDAGVYGDAMDSFPLAEQQGCPFVVVCDTEKGSGAQFADCSNCVMEAIEICIGRLQHWRLRSVGYSVALPRGADLDALNNYLANRALMSHTAGNA